MLRYNQQTSATTFARSVSLPEALSQYMAKMCAAFHGMTNGGNVMVSPLVPVSST